MASTISTQSRKRENTSYENFDENHTELFEAHYSNGYKDLLGCQEENAKDKIGLWNSEESWAHQEPFTPSHQKAVSKRSLHLVKLKGEVGSDDKPKGQIMFDDKGILYQRESDKEAWKPAIFHHELRATLIVRASEMGQYDHERARGHDDLDVTSFLPNQKTWGASREHWPDILHQIYEKPEQKKQGTKAKIWWHDGKIVIDPDNHPVLNYPEIPATCSSELEGWYMQAIRRHNHQISIRDFRARMPHRVGRNQKSLYRVNAISMRMTRFRAQAGCQVWNLRAGSKAINDYMMGLYPAFCIETNSTRGFLGPTKEQALEMSHLLKGKFPERGRARFEEHHIDQAEVIKADGVVRVAHCRSRAGQKREHDSLEEQESYQNETPPPPAKRTRTNYSANEAPSYHGLKRVPLCKQASEGDASSEENASYKILLDDLAETKRPRHGVEYDQGDEVMISRLSPQLFPAPVALARGLSDFQGQSSKDLTG